MNLPDVSAVTWDDLRYLEALDRLGKVRSAARDQRISVSTFYRRVGELEAQFGQLCLVRRAEGASLTELGRALAQVGRRVRGGLTEVLGELKAGATLVGGEVSLTTVEALLPLIERPLAELTATHPALEVALHLGDAGPSVRRREVDVALAVMQRPPAGCWGRRVARLPYGVFATPAEAARAQRRWVARARSEASSPESAWEREHAGPIAVRAPFHALVSLCASGAGLGLMPRALGLRRGLVELPEFGAKVARLQRTVWCLAHPDQKKTPRVLALMSALARAFEP
jgi:DNA-binding transcriptional LysR family regulator